MIDIIDRLTFDSARCEATFSKGVASNIDDGIAEIKRLRQLAADLSRPLVEMIIAYQDADSPDIQDTIKRGREAVTRFTNGERT